MSGQGDAATFEPYQRMGIESGGFMRLEYNFVSLARRFAVGLTVAMWVVPLLPVVAEYVVHPVAFAVQIFIATCMGVIELPFCCTGLAFCRRLQPWMAPFETYWLRAVLYLVFGVTLGLVDWYVDDKSNLQLWIYSVLLAVLAILYLLAYLNGERSAEEWENDPVESTGVGGGSWLPSWPWSSSSAPETLSVSPSPSSPFPPFPFPRPHVRPLLLSFLSPHLSRTIFSPHHLAPKASSATPPPAYATGVPLSPVAPLFPSYFHAPKTTHMEARFEWRRWAVCDAERGRGGRSGEEQAKHDLDLQRQALRAAMATAMKF